MIDRKKQESKLYEMLSVESNKKIEIADVSTEAYLLARDEIDFLVLDLSGPLQDWVMVYFYGYGRYTGFIILDSKQEKVLSIGVLNEKNQVVRSCRKIE